MYKYIILGGLTFCSFYTNAQTSKNLKQERSINSGQIELSPEHKSSLKTIKDNPDLRSTINKQGGDFKVKLIPEDDITGFLETPNGLLYKFIKKGTGKKSANVDDQGSLHIEFKMGDTVVINSRSINDNKPVIEQLKSPKFNGDVSEGILMMKPGDIAVFKLLLSDMELRTNHKTPPFVKNGKYATWTVEMVDLKTKAELQEEEKLTIKKEEEVIKAAIAKNKQKAERLESGVYLVRHNKVTGEKPVKDKVVTVNYTGKLMDGTSFDSNVDPKFNHVSPFQFPVGIGKVIKGWDHAILNMQKGEKVTIYIPSSLAYGKHSPTPAIPANSILVFDLELLDFE